MARSLRVAPGGVHSPVRSFRSVGGTPVFFSRAQGPYLTSVEGRKYIDFCMSFGPLLLGHRDPEVERELELAIKSVWSLGAAEPYSLELSEWITERVPWAEKIRFVSSGTEAVMSALRLARAATGRERVLKFEGCYHGHVDSMLVKSGSGLAGEATSDSAGVGSDIAKTTLVCPLDDERSLREIFARFGSEIAAVIIEPLPANYGLLEQRPEFLRELAALTRQHQALLIFDEVISGFRVALGGMAERLDLRPDLVTFGKVIGGGFPVGAYAGRTDLMQQVAPTGPVYQAGTLSASPIGVRVGLASLKKIVRENLYAQLDNRTRDFAAQFNEHCERLGLPFAMSHYSSLFWLHPPKLAAIRRPEQIPAEHAQHFAALFHGCLERGVYLAPSSYEVGFLSAAHDEKVLAEALQHMIAAAQASSARGSGRCQ